MKTLLKLAESKQLDFPRLYRSTQGGRVVLFCSLNSGTVVIKGNRPDPVGHYADHWIECTDLESWEPLPKGSTVTLEQE